MKKKNLSKLALKGLSAGLLLSATQISATEMGSMLAQGCGGSSRAWNQQSNAPQPSCGGQQANANSPYRYKEFTQTISQGCSPRTQNINTPQGSCGGSAPIAAGCGANCSGRSIADADEANTGMREAQRKYYDSSEETQHRMTPERSQMTPQGKYLADAQMTSGQKIQTEAELLSRLDAQGKATYHSLTAQGKALALQFANEDNGNKYPDKNMAVRAAAERTNATQKKMGY